jgi:hypothetical protein
MQNVLENGLKDFHDNNRAPQHKWSEQFTWEKATKEYCRV